MSASTKSFRAMLLALAVDNFGSGLFLPLTLIYLTRVVGLPLSEAGPAVALGTLAGILMPAVAAAQVDRRGARTVVCLSQFLQALGMIGLLFAQGLALVLAGTVLAAAGSQLFYAALGTMASDTSGARGQDRAFALMGMARASAFGLGGLSAGVLLSLSNSRSSWLSVGVGANALSFLVAAAVLLFAVPSVRSRHRGGRDASGQGSPAGDRLARAWADRPYLVLVATTFLLMLSVDMFLLTMPIYVHDYLHAPGWTIGACIAVSTAVRATLGGTLVRLTSHLTRTACLAMGGTAVLCWTLGMAGLVLVPAPMRTAGLLGLQLVLSFGLNVGDPRLPAILSAIAPVARKGVYFAYFQYAFTAASLVAPLITTMLAWHPTAPWLFNSALVLLSLLGVAWLNGHLPAHARGQGGSAVPSL